MDLVAIGEVFVAGEQAFVLVAQTANEMGFDRFVRGRLGACCGGSWRVNSLMLIIRLLLLLNYG